MSAVMGPRSRPCPFCGHNDISIKTADSHWSTLKCPPHAFAVCLTCGAQGPIVIRCYDLTEGECMKNAMEAWERRFTV